MPFKFGLICKIFVLMVPCGSLAENSGFVALWNQVEGGQNCFATEKEDLNWSSLTCRKSVAEKLQKMKIPSQAVAYLAYQAAAEAQMVKDQCFLQMTNAIFESPELLRRWVNALYVTWLGKRKADLIFQICSPVQKSLGGMGSADAQIPPVNYQSLHQDAEKDHRKNDLKKKSWTLQTQGQKAQLSDEEVRQWQPICSNQRAMSALSQASSLFPYAIPMVNSPEIFQLIEKHRDRAVDQRTHRPLSDEDLLKMDLSNISVLRNRLKIAIEIPAPGGAKQVFSKGEEKSSSQLTPMETFKNLEQITQDVSSLRSKDAFPRELRQLVDKLIQGRQKSLEMVQREMKLAQGDFFTKATRDYFYQEGTLEEALMAESNAISDSQATCLLSWHDPNLVAELVQMGGASVIGGAALLQLVRKAPTAGELAKLLNHRSLKSLPRSPGTPDHRPGILDVTRAQQGPEFVNEMNRMNRLQQWKKAGSMAGGPVAVNALVQELHESCSRSSAGISRLADADLRNANSERAKALLPKEVGFKHWRLTDPGENLMDAKKIPACQKSDAKNFILNLEHQTNCVRAALESALPLGAELTIQEIEVNY